MNYLIKAYLQKVFAMVPRSFGDQIYYQIQRRFGSLRWINSCQYIDNAIRISAACSKSGFQIQGRKLFELGTGRTVSTPIVMVLQGADSVITVDANRYLRTDLSFESAVKVIKNVKDLGWNNKLNEYEEFVFKLAAESRRSSPNINDILNLFNIFYYAPFDGRKTGIESGSIDLYFSTNVIEHVSREQIVDLFKEAKRIIGADGIMAHYIDLRDHFAATDKKITNVNFLKYSIRDWERLAGNRFMYQNRLRFSDYINLFSELGFVPLSIDKEIDDRSVTALRGGFKVDPIFKDYDYIDLSTVGLTVVGKFIG